MNPYEAKHHDELSFEKGVLLEVFEKGIDGWWRVRYVSSCCFVAPSYFGGGGGGGGLEALQALQQCVLS